MSDDNEIKVLKVKGKLMYARLFRPDTTFEDRWTVDVLLDEEGKKEAEANSLRVKHRDNYKDLFDGYDGSYLRVDRPVTGRDGERERPVVKDAKLRDLPVDTGIGNGTDANVRFIVKTMDASGNTMSPAQAMKKYKGYGMFLTGVQILDLVPYERSGDPDLDFVEEDGFTAGDTGGFDFEKGDEPFDDVSMAG